MYLIEAAFSTLQRRPLFGLANGRRLRMTAPQMRTRLNDIEGTAERISGTGGMEFVKKGHGYYQGNTYVVLFIQKYVSTFC